MRRILNNSGFLALVFVAGLTGCGGSSNSGAGAGGGSGTGGGGGVAGGGGGGAGGGGGSGTAGGGGSGGGSTSGAATNGIFTAMPLPDDTSDPNNTISHSTDIVSAVYYDTATHGVVATSQGETAGLDTGGGIFVASGTAIIKQTYSGHQTSSDGSENDVSFHDLLAVGNNTIIASTVLQDFTISSDNGATWKHTTPYTNGADLDLANLEAAAPMPTGSGWWIMTDDAIWTTGGSLATPSAWTTVWDPEATPTVPFPLPAAPSCQTTVDPATPYQLPNRLAYISPDGSTIAYPLRLVSGICVSNDGGATYIEHDLPNAPVDGDGDQYGPTGLAFTDKLHGWTYFGEDLEDASAFVYYTVDGGVTWTAGTLPAALLAAGAKVSLRDAFFAPDSKTGYIVGYKGNEVSPLLLKSTDGGKTWSDISASLAGIGNIAAPQKLFSGFALDATHVWIGGENGVLLYSTTGGTK